MKVLKRKTMLILIILISIGLLVSWDAKKSGSDFSNNFLADAKIKLKNMITLGDLWKWWENSCFGSAHKPKHKSVREVRLLDNEKWKFIQDDTISDETILTADTTNWSNVTLPHTWNKTDAASIIKQDEPYKRGLGWYKLEFDFNLFKKKHWPHGIIPKTKKSGKEISAIKCKTRDSSTHWIQFDGASLVADVWLNGTKLGIHSGGFTRFRFDVTDKLVQGTNTFFVKCDNRKAETGSNPTAIAPLSGDFNISGGLYRSVKLISTPDKAHFALDDLGSSGLFISTTAIDTSEKTATLNILSKVSNDDSSSGKYTVKILIKASNGKTKALSSKEVIIESASTTEVNQEIALNSVHLWNGISDPYLYTIKAYITNSKGFVIDEVSLKYGIRKMVFNADSGFYLNDVPTPLRGVCMHQDYQDMAWAITKEQTDESLALVQEIGANTIRLAHYPHSEYTLQKCDEIGLVVWAELPFVDQSVVGTAPPMGPPSGDLGNNDTSYLETFSANAKLQLQELIRQQYNHPSIGMWSIANEVSHYPKTADGTDTVTQLLRDLNELANTEDPYRVTTLADFNPNTVGRPAFSTLGITDIGAVNRYYGWYYGDTNTLDEKITDEHYNYPSHPLGISEYGAGSAVSHHTDNVFGGPVIFYDFSNKTRIAYQPEGYANYLHESTYRIIQPKSWLWGTYVWNMFDFGSGVRHEGDVENTNTKGLVSFDRKTKKDVFYFYKANWNSEAMVYITGKRYTNRAYKYADIKVYSNTDYVTLKVNDIVVDVKTPDSVKVCEFKNVVLAAGDNMIVAEGTGSGTMVSDTVAWTLSDDNESNVYIASGQIATGFTYGGHTYGSDNFFSNGSASMMYSYYDRTLPKDTSGNEFGDSSIYDCVRMSSGTESFSYSIPLAYGTYIVSLGFIEPSSSVSAGQRVFKVSAEGEDQLTNIDIISEAGVYRKAVTPKTFTVTVSDGILNLVFVPTSGSGAVVSNISVIKQ